MDRMRFGRRQLVFSQAVCLLVLATGCFSPTQPTEAQLAGTPEARCITPDEAEHMAEQVLQLVNLERIERALPPVAVNEALKQIAEEYACQMAAEGFFGHEDPVTGHGPAERAIVGRYLFWSVGENLAAGAETPAEVMKLWMDSPSHRDIILDPGWKELGIAVRSGGVYSTYWVQEFGDPAGR